jgi:hypothetical protein
MRNRLKPLTLFFCLFALGCAGAREASAHTFHTSLMQVEYNRQEQLVEIAVHLFSHDLETVLTRRAGRRVRLDRTTDAQALTLAYLRSAFSLRNRSGQEKTLEWVGMEQKADAVWLYVEAKMPEGLDGAQVRNSIFFDLLDDQVNRVHIKYEGRKADLFFKPGDSFKPVSPQAATR